MTKVFYDHLTITEEVTGQLDNFEITVVEKEELIQLIDENIHHRVLDVILKNLPKEKHSEFLMKFHHTPNDKNLLDYLKSEVADIEDIISEEAKRVKKELIAEIKKAQK